MKETLDLLKKLTEIGAPSGNEIPLARFLVDYMRSFAQEVEVDRLGNVMALVTPRKPGAKRIMISAHMDEVSFMVHKIQQNGFIKITRNGGIPEKNLLGQLVELLSDQGSISGLIGTRSHHLTGVEQRYQVVPIEDLFIDAGFRSKEEAEAAGVRVGTPVVYKRTFFRNGSRIFSNALDDRIGITAMLEAGKRLAAAEPDAEIWLVGSVQEEWSLRGILPATRHLKPDMTLCVDIYPSTDTPDLDYKADLALGGGPVISEYNFHGRGTLMGLIPDPALRDTALEAARQAGIPVQRGALIGVLTDASYVQYEGTGIATLDMAIAARYSHSAVESSDVEDLKQLIELIVRTTLLWISSPQQSRKDLILG
ncbi:M42 family metallopeptidase [Paenibacillaceae bacterium WGS1546]|uniref:M42 family metallopeptidase n=1 Tax=Cohnella sp. WGS1546 TaxID=3366810 RepID=UPI00372D7A4C